MTRETRHWLNEPDIGSGEKAPGQNDIEKAERSLGAPDSGEDSYHRAEGQKEEHDNSRILRSGTHLARLATVAQDDGTWEAQVYVRLTREPEIAETYIPVGLFPTEPEAWAAAEERARRAFDENEF